MRVVRKQCETMRASVQLDNIRDVVFIVGEEFDIFFVVPTKILKKHNHLQSEEATGNCAMRVAKRCAPKSRLR